MNSQDEKEEHVGVRDSADPNQRAPSVQNKSHNLLPYELLNHIRDSNQSKRRNRLQQ